MTNIILVTLCAMLLACEKAPLGPVVSKTYTVNQVTRLFVDDNIHVKLLPDTINKLVIEAPEKAIDGIKQYKGSDSLYLVNENKHNWLNYTDSVIVTVHFGNHLTSINTMGTGNIHSVGTLQPNKLTLYAWEGASDFYIDIVAGHLRMVSHSITTSGFYVNGRVNTVNLAIKGRGKVNALLLDCPSVDVKHYGANHLFLFADSVLSGNLYGVGNIYFTGQPDIVSVNITGDGKLLEYQ